MNIEIYKALPVLLGSIIDTILGDPYSLPHPIRLFGNIISFFERHLNHGTHRKLKGAFMSLVLVSSVWLFFSAMLYLTKGFVYVHLIITTLFFFYGISSRSLLDEAWKVERKLILSDLEGARQQLSWIVGRDTAKLTPGQIRMATLETLSENLSDGVVAPLFYYALGGIPAMMAYKMINTLDSMVGYKNERFRMFGYFSAKLDDVANFIPARLTALFMVIVSGSIRSFKFIRLYGSKHASPNSGYPESALAGILNCRMGGPNVYHGQIVEKPYIGDNPREVSHKDFLKACNINIKVMILSVFILLLYVIF